MIQARVKINTLKREGRGFSIGELKKVGLTVVWARDIDIRIDKRRRSVHKINIDQLKNLLVEKEKEVKKAEKKVKPLKRKVKEIEKRPEKKAIKEREKKKTKKKPVKKKVAVKKIEKEKSIKKRGKEKASARKGVKKSKGKKTKGI